MSEDICSITIKGLSKETKDNFALFCSMQGKSMQEVLQNFISSAYTPNENQKLAMKYQTLMSMLQNHVDIIDKWIEELEPLYRNLNNFQRQAARFNYINFNPTYFYNKTVEWLNNDDSVLS